MVLPLNNPMWIRLFWGKDSELETGSSDTMTEEYD